MRQERAGGRTGERKGEERILGKIRGRGGWWGRKRRDAGRKEEEVEER